MNDRRKTRAQLAAELNDLRQRMAELEAVAGTRRASDPRRDELPARSQLVLDSMPLGGIIIDPEGRISYWNPAAEKIFGYSPAEVLGLLHYEVTVPADAREYVSALLARTAQGQVTTCGENNNMTKAGNVIVCEWHNTPLRDAAGRYLGILAMAQDITARKQAEAQREAALEALRASEDKFKYVFDRSIIGKSITGLTGEMQVNEAFGTMLGYSLEEFQHHRWEEFTHPDDQALSQREVDALLSGLKESVRFTKRYLHKSGSVVWADVNSSLRRDDTGRPLYMISAIMDITERKQAEFQREAALAALRQSEEKYRLLFDNAGDAIFIHDEAGRMLAVNAQAVERLGYTHAELLSLRIDQVDSPDESRFALERIDRLMRQGYHTFETVHQRQDGTRVPTEVSARRIVWEGIPAMMSICRDVTARKQTESQREAALEAVHRLNRELRAISTCHQILVRAADEQALLHDICRIICDEAGYTMAWVGYAEQDEAKTVRPVAWAGAENGYLAVANITWGDAERGHGPSGTAIRTGQSVYIQGYGTDPRVGLWRANALQRGYQSCLALPLKDESAHTFGALAIYSTAPDAFTPDETRLLEELAADLTFGILVLRVRAEHHHAEEQLLRVQKLESLGILAGGVAHDFNNLLVALLGQTSLAAAKLPSDHPVQQHLERAVSAARRAATLTHQMLAYSGHGGFQMAPLDLNAFIRANRGLLESSISKAIALRTDLAQALPLIEADAGQLQQIIMNLVLNSAEAIGERAGTISLATDVIEVTADDGRWTHYTGQAMAAGHYVQLRVQDSGCGMSGETLERIFDPFFTTKFTGRGLGLAAVQGIVRGHRGGLWVDSEVDRGATFILVFPVTAEEAVTAAQTASQPASPQPLVLIIDDEEPVREAVTDMLALDNVATLCAATGAEGLVLFRERQAEIGLVLLDLSMPGLSGRETFDRLVEIDSQACIVLSSGYTQAEATRDFAGRSLAGFLHKPYDLETLLETVRQHLHGQQP